MVSVAASMATMKFNQIFAKEAQEFYIANDECESDEIREKLESYEDVLERAARKGAVFDARAFTDPIEEVNDCYTKLNSGTCSITVSTQGNSGHQC